MADDMRDSEALNKIPIEQHGEIIRKGLEVGEAANSTEYNDRLYAAVSLGWILRRHRELEQRVVEVEAALVAMFQEHSRACDIARDANERVQRIIAARLPLGASTDAIAAITEPTP